jgi:hypothetical protein
MVSAVMPNLLLADWFAETTSGMMPDHRFALIVIVIGCATGVICTVAMYLFHTINSIHRRRIEADMKRDMLDRGMSADEIAKVIEAASPPEDGTQRWIASWARKSKLA